MLIDGTSLLEEANAKQDEILTKRDTLDKSLRAALEALYGFNYTSIYSARPFALAWGLTKALFEDAQYQDQLLHELDRLVHIQQKKVEALSASPGRKWTDRRPRRKEEFSIAVQVASTKATIYLVETEHHLSLHGDKPACDTPSCPICLKSRQCLAVTAGDYRAIKHDILSCKDAN